MAKITKFKDRNFDWEFKVFMYPNEYIKVHKGITEQQAQDKAWDYLTLGFMEKVGHKTVCGDSITLVEIKKVRKKKVKEVKGE